MRGVRGGGHTLDTVLTTRPHLVGGGGGGGIEKCWDIESGGASMKDLTVAALV